MLLGKLKNDNDKNQLECILYQKAIYLKIFTDKFLKETDLQNN